MQKNLKRLKKKKVILQYYRAKNNLKNDFIEKQNSQNVLRR